MKRKKLYFLLFIFSLLGCLNSFAQVVTVNATIDSSDIKIGEQRRIRLEMVQPQNMYVQFPIVSLTDTLVPGVEVISASKMDTIVETATSIKVYQDIIVTSFDTGKYVIPPFLFVTKLKKLNTEKLFLNVSTVEADFKSSEITDINENYDPGFNWVRLLLYLSIPVILLCLAFIGYTVYQFYKQKRLKEQEQVVKVDLRPPHEIALQELDEIQEQKIWKQGLTKQYYTNITDTLRGYFEKRFDISAKEMTSTEILDSLKYNSDTENVYNIMRQIFYTSDMVKFAKQEPTQEENELSILNAYRIVNETKKNPTTEQITDNTQGTANNVSSGSRKDN